MTINIQLGALAPKLRVQLRDQGIRFPPGISACLQSDADAITRLKIRGFITEKMADSARAKLIRLVGTHMKAKYDVARLPCGAEGPPMSKPLVLPSRATLERIRQYAEQATSETHPQVYDGLRRRHTRKVIYGGHVTNMCRACGETFPCATTQLLGERDSLLQNATDLPALLSPVEWAREAYIYLRNLGHGHRTFEKGCKCERCALLAQVVVADE